MVIPISGRVAFLEFLIYEIHQFGCHSFVQVEDAGDNSRLDNRNDFITQSFAISISRMFSIGRLSGSFSKIKLPLDRTVRTPCSPILRSFSKRLHFQFRVGSATDAPEKSNIRCHFPSN